MKKPGTPGFFIGAPHSFKWNQIEEELHGRLDLRDNIVKHNTLTVYI